MKIKKNPKSNLENYSKLFVQLGLVLALFVTYVAMENKTFDKPIDLFGNIDLQGAMDEQTPITVRPEPVKPKPKPAPAPDIIEIVEDDKEVVESIIETTETNETEAIKVEDIEEIEEVDDIVENVPISLLEEVPVFPGCKGTRAEKINCLNKKIKKHVLRRFNNELAGELGLASGKNRIWVVFRIDPKGNVTEIQVKAPHPRLKKEAVRVAKTLPKMIPGKQGGVPVGMKYTLPISFNVE